MREELHQRMAKHDTQLRVCDSRVCHCVEFFCKSQAAIDTYTWHSLTSELHTSAINFQPLISCIVYAPNWYLHKLPRIKFVFSINSRNAAKEERLKMSAPGRTRKLFLPTPYDISTVSKSVAQGPQNSSVVDKQT